VISNQPRIKGRTTFAYTKIENAFSREEVASFVEYCSSLKNELKEATIVGGADAPKIRISQTLFQQRNNENAWFFERMNQVFEFANNEFYNFDLWGYETFQYGEYLGSQGGKYDLHTDMLTDDINELNAGAYHEGTRKLSATIMLSEQGTDFEGGDFVVATGKEQNAEIVNIPIGGVVVFPSFIVHGVRPVTSGVRKSAVIWVVGPKFR
jgi:predicted 2-oxoglutarate/Fe(II)-dependent dioxygenase YbiX